MRLIFQYLSTNKSKLIKFVIVGISTYLFNNFIFWMLSSKLGLNYKYSITIAYFLTVAVHFYLNRFFTYSRFGGVKLTKDLGRYAVMLTVNYGLTISIVTFTVEVLGISPYFGILLSTMVNGFTSFVMMNHFVFHRKENI